MSRYPQTPSSKEAYTFTQPGPITDVLQPTVRPLTLPADDEVLIDVKAVGLNPCDIQIAGWWLWNWKQQGEVKGVGQDYAGVVREVGSEALKTHSFLQPGSPVFGLLFNPGSPDSALSTHVKIKPNSDHPCVLPLPSQLSFEEAASIPLVFVTVMTALCQYGLLDRLPSASNAKRSIAIVGASGGTGVYAVQVAKRLLGVGHVLGVCSRSNAEFLEGLGADDVLRYDEEDVVDGLRKRKPEGGWDVVLDLVGGRDVWDGFGPLASKDGGGFVTIVGDKTGRSEMGGAFTNLVNPIQSLRQFLGWLGLTARYHCINLTADVSNIAPVLQLIEKGNLEVPIDSVFTFNKEDVHKAFQRLDTGRAKGKVVVSLERG